MQNYEILQAKANFPLCEREEFHEYKPNEGFKICLEAKL